MRALLWCNGQQPSEHVVQALLHAGSTVFGVDGGADKAARAGITVEEVLGDLDSVELGQWEGRTYELPDDSSSDLAKSIALLIERGYTDIEVVGSDGGSTGHVLGGWAALCEAPGGARIRVHHEDSITHRIHPQDGGTEFDISDGQEFSVFALSPCGGVHLQGAAWNLDGVPLGLSTRGLHNRGTGEVVRISADGILAVIIPRGG